jgi:UrcA family protein
MNTQVTGVTNLLVVAAALAVGMLAGVTHAAEAEVPTQTVRFQDLNLNTDAGVQVLYQRIQGAANQVCGDVDGRDLVVARAHKACVGRAVADAVAIVNNQMLTKTVTVAQVR